ncbi:ABC transporter permease, partial [candidate division KSB1 bacterium]
KNCLVQCSRQFIGESVLLSLISFLISIILIPLLLAVINNFIEGEITLNVLKRFDTLGGIVLIVLITGLISGIYPALFLSSFKPVSILKGISNIGKGGHTKFIRKTLVTIQFSVSIIY